MYFLLHMGKGHLHLMQMRCLPPNFGPSSFILDFWWSSSTFLGARESSSSSSLSLHGVFFAFECGLLRCLFFFDSTLSRFSTLEWRQQGSTPVVCREDGVARELYPDSRHRNRQRSRTCLHWKLFSSDFLSHA